MSSASQYGAIFFNHDRNSLVAGNASNEIYSDLASQQCANTTETYLENSECDRYGAGIGYTIAYNFSALHGTVGEDNI
jgi:hypothetical protein